MNILIFMSGGFDTYGPSRHLYETLIEDILKNNHQVFLLESHSTGNDPDVPEKFVSNKNFSYKVIDIKVVEKNAFFKRYLTGVRYCFKSIKHLRILSKQRFDVALVQSCPWAPFAVSFVKKYVKSYTIWNIQDMFPGASIANGVMKRKWMQKFFYSFHKIAYNFADHITVISDDMKNKVIEQSVPGEKVSVIPDWYDDESVKEILWEDNLFVKKHNMNKDVFYVQYAGTMGYNFDYQMVISVAELLRNETNIIFQMIGFGSQKDAFMETVRAKKLQNIIFLPLEPQEMVSHVYSACSVCFIPLPKGVIGNSVPSKLALLMACKRPIITSSDESSLYNHFINEHKIGYAFSTEEANKIASVIKQLKNNLSQCVQYGINGYNYGHIFYSRSRNTEKYINLFLLGSNNNNG